MNPTRQPKVRRVSERWLALYRPGVREEWGVSQHPGLRVRIGREVAWYYYTTEKDGPGKAKRKGYQLGRWPDVSMAAAAKEVLRLKGQGPERRKVSTVEDVFLDFEKEKLAGQVKGFEVAATLRLHALQSKPVPGAPAFGQWKVPAVQKAHLVQLVRKCAETKHRDGSRTWGGPGAARALAKALKVLFRHAEDIGAADRNVAESLSSGGAVERDTWLRTEAELAAFFEAVDLRALLAGEAAPSSTSATVRLGLAFLAFVPVRKDCFRLAKWEEVDFTAGTWTVPGERLKAPSEKVRRKREDKVVQLPPTALAILQVLRRLSPVGCEWVLPSPFGDRVDGPLECISEQTLISSLVRLQSDGRLTLPPDKRGTPRRLTVHDLRRSWASWAASDAVGANPIAVELVLDHSLEKKLGLSSSFGTYVHSRIAAKDQAVALEAVDGFYRAQWDRQASAVGVLPPVAPRASQRA